ncbi:MAG: WG repeat-containing protein, partial [Cytophagales bacterium]|nr:WG repeat-containing protein [Cytophaga sp.]
MLRYHLIVILFFNILLCTAQKIVYYEGLASFKTTKNSKNLYGFKDEKGRIIIPARYDSIAEPFRFGRAIVIINNQYGTIDKKGREIIPFIYTGIVAEQYGLTPVKVKEGVWGFYSYKGILVIPCMYNNFKFANKGKHIIVQKDGKWGIINHRNTPLIACEYKIIEPQSGKQYRLTHYNKWERSNTSSNVLSTYEYDSVRFANTKLFSFNMNGWKGLMKEDGAVLLKNSFEEIGDIQGDLIALKQNGVWGVKKANSSIWILPSVYNIVRIDSIMIYAGITFGSSGLIHWRFYNLSGNLLNQEAFVDYRPICNEMMAVKSTSNKWGFINERGKNSIARFYTSVSD